MARRVFPLLVVSLGVWVSSCTVTSHPVAKEPMGIPKASSELEGLLDAPGPIEFEKVVAADWSVPLSGLLNLDHPKAKAAGLQDRDEAIQIYFYALRHPSRGLFLVDTGVERVQREGKPEALLSGVVGRVMDADKMKVRVDTASWLEGQKDQKLSGVFLTHFHLDHILGLRDIPKGVPLYAGPGETDTRQFQNLFVRGITDDALSGHGPLQSIGFRPDPDGKFAGIADVFGDGSVWALHVPGHTRGSMAILARTPRGPVLMTGDACHTAFGWKEGIEPGSFSSDVETSAVSLQALQDLVRRHPRIEVHPGHQSL
jgi:N-acyl homoserine lactone hydrolase